MESARSWSGYVCPECRMVFRVPKDHDGMGVLCPGCRRMLRIPASGERLPPLVVPISGAAPEVANPHDSPDREKSRRRKKKRSSGKPSGPEWEAEWDRPQSSGRRERGALSWAVIGGVTLLVLLLVAAVMFPMFGNNGRMAPPPPPVVEVAEPAPAAPSEQEKGTAALLAEAEPVVRQFLEAGRIEDMLPLVHKPEIAEPRMRRFYQNGEIDAPGMAEFNTGGAGARSGKFVSTVVRTSDYEERVIAFRDTPEGVKIDWESWVGWSEMPWAEFLATKPTSGKLFRVALSEVEYFNFAFSDDEYWQSFRLVSPDGEHSLYGYVERDSVLASRLRPAPEVKKVALTLVLKFPENAASKNQVVIEELIAEGWVLDSEETP